MLKKQFGSSGIWITVFTLLEQLEKNNITEVTKSRELAEDKSHLTKSVDVAYHFIPEKLNLTKVK